MPSGSLCGPSSFVETETSSFSSSSSSPPPPPGAGGQLEDHEGSGKRVEGGWQPGRGRRGVGGRTGRREGLSTPAVPHLMTQLTPGGVLERNNGASTQFEYTCPYTHVQLGMASG